MIRTIKTEPQVQITLSVQEARGLHTLLECGVSGHLINRLGLETLNEELHEHLVDEFGKELPTIELGTFSKVVSSDSFREYPNG